MKARIALADLGAQHREVAAELEVAFRRVVASSRFILGEEVQRFERQAAELVGAAHAIGTSSGTDALQLALMALGVGPGDEVVTSTFTFVATAESVLRLGARPRFVDVDPRTLCLTVDGVAAALGPRTRVVLPVHLYGAAAPVEGLARLCAARGVPLVEDAAQALGTRLAGRSAGTWGTLGCFSFFPGKVLGALGDAGLVVTEDAGLAERCRRLRQHGVAGPGEHAEVGGNFRLDALQAAFLAVKLPRLRAHVTRRRAHGARYDAGLAGLEALAPVARGDGWNGAVYTVRVGGGRRDALREHLDQRGVDSAVYYAAPLHLQGAFAGLGHGPGDFPESERAAAEVLSLPVHEGLEASAIDHVVAAIRGFYR